MILLEAQAVTKELGGYLAVSGVSLKLEAGEIRSIIGPNGAGKTTLFNLIAGNYWPTAGRIVFQGKDITELPRFRRSQLGISKADQIISIFPSLSVLENVRVSAQSRDPLRMSLLRRAGDLRKAFEVAERVVEQVGLTGVKDEPAGIVSHGDQKRLEMGIALATEPVLLLLDEPTSGMSVDEAQKMVALIQQIARTVTVVCIEHDVDVVFSISDRITVMNRGRVIAEGPPAEIANNTEVQRAYLMGVTA